MGPSMSIDGVLPQIDQLDEWRIVLQWGRR